MHVSTIRVEPVQIDPTSDDFDRRLLSNHVHRYLSLEAIDPAAEPARWQACWLARQLPASSLALLHWLKMTAGTHAAAEHVRQFSAELWPGVYVDPDFAAVAVFWI